MRKTFLSALPIVLTTFSVMMAVDLYLPAIPDLPSQLGGTAVDAQYTLAAFLASFAMGQVVFGLFADRVDRRWLLTAALVGLGLSSLAAAQVDDMSQLIAIRFVQGLAASGGVALVPAMLRELGDNLTVIRLIGAINTIEAIVPAFAPAVGTWLVKYAGWRASFVAVAAMSAVAVTIFQILPARGRADKAKPNGGLFSGYRALLSSRAFLGYTLTHALSIGALDTFVLAAPYVITAHAGGTIEQFAVMQLVLVACYVVAANLAPFVVKRIGGDDTILLGGILLVIGSAALLGSFFLMPKVSVLAMAITMLPVFVGIGLRGAVCFTQAMDVVPAHAGGAGALVIFMCLLVSATGTPVIAPFLPTAPIVLAMAVALQAVGALAIFVLARDRRPQSVPR